MSQSVATPPSGIDPVLDRPIEASGNAAVQNADDLIAALAGEQIDRLLAESDLPAVPATPPPPAPMASGPAAATAVSAAELDAVLAEAAGPTAATPSPVESPPAVAAPAKRKPASAPSVPLLLKPLVWANAPLAACPDRVREAAGKIAIVTFVNAVGVLVYTFAFHRPR